MTPLVVLAIKHSGTTFTTNLVKGDRKPVGGLARRLLTYNAAHLINSDGYCFIHVHDFTNEQLANLCRYCTIVVPIRHPLDVAKSWHTRGHKIDPMLECWDRLIALSKGFSFNYLPIDSPRRESYRIALERKLGQEFNTDWASPNHFESDKQLSREDGERVWEFFAQRQFFNQFYGASP